MTPTYTDEQFECLFNPRGVVVVGASVHPGKFGYVALHNIVSSGYSGNIAATNRLSANVLGIQTVPHVSEIGNGDPSVAFDLAFICTPKAVNEDIIVQCATRGIRAVFMATAGYGEADEQGKADQQRLVVLCEELGILLVGPNGQGVVSTPASLCAQIVAPYPPCGVIGVASQSGNFVSSFENWSIASGIGISRAVSAGNSAAATVDDFFDYFSRDPETLVALGYVEGVPNGREFFESLKRITPTMPVVIVKGGSTDDGSAAAASHTGSLASNDRVFDGAMAQAGVIRADNPEEAFEAAATLSTQPLPRGNKVAVITTAGGWGVVTADAVSQHSALELLSLPKSLRQTLDTHLPPRWSKNNPIDLAGGETRDTIVDVLGCVAEHDNVDAIVFLGLGIQSNQATMMKSGPFAHDESLQRIVAYHERQDSRFACAAHDLSVAHNKPILCATELSEADPTNAGVRAVRASGRMCYTSSVAAVTALGHLVTYARFLKRVS